MTPEQAKKLREPFRPEQIGKIPKGGVEVDYVGHAATTDRLLQVDPDWTWEPMSLDPVTGAPLIVDGGLWIRLTVCGVTRPGFGDGKNAKEIIGDAIRNAAMRFGVALDLWAKEDLLGGKQPVPVRTSATPALPAEKENWRRDYNRNVAPGPPATGPELTPEQRINIADAPVPMNDGQRKRMMALFKEQGFLERQHRLAYSSSVIGRHLESANKLTREEAQKIITTLETRDEAAPDDVPDVEPDIPF